LLFNIYLNELDRFIEDTLIPAYTKGDRRQTNRRWKQRYDRARRLRRDGRNLDEADRIERELRHVPTVEPFDPDYRRLCHVRYADDFLLGFAGPKCEAEAIRDRLAQFLGVNLKLQLSVEKTLITNAADEKAKFLGYEITTTRSSGARSANGYIALLMPPEVVRKLTQRYSREGKVRHRKELLTETDYTILNRYQSVLRGLYNYYCLATNVSKRMTTAKWILETSLTKTLASKLKCKVSAVYRRYQVVLPDRRFLQVIIERTGKKPLVAEFGGFPLVRKPDGMGMVDFRYEPAWHSSASNRSEAVLRMLAGKCQLCGAEGPVQMHHIRKLADLNQPGRAAKAAWQVIMSARKRKMLAVCEDCHQSIHQGKYDGPSLLDLLESRMR